MAAEYTKTPINVRQSPPLDLSKPYNPDWLKSRVIIVTGGASGFGAGFVRKWAAHGATVIIGDINVEKGDKVARQARQESRNQNIHFVHCDVTDWQSQVNLFKEAVRLSPHGGIDAVIANAGIGGNEPLHMPQDFSGPEPKKPNFKVIDVNLYGVLYTTQLALYWLQKNPGSKPCSPDTDPAKTPRDRHLLLVGSMASLAPIVSQPLYGTAKHGVLGLFRSLRASSFVDGVRVTAIFPYFMETPLMHASGRLLMAGGAMGKAEDVVDAATRLVADSRIVGRGLAVGAKAKVKQEENGEWVVVPKDSPDGEERAVWEAYADDFEDSERFTHQIVRILNRVARAKGWIGWFSDIIAALRYGLFG
jgi:NAD(P)-dependent dehydrogenase (short-subunit alcohol dehydrogenase family)